MIALPALRAQQSLLRALRPVAGPFSLLASSSRDWSSATFEGARHRLALRLDGEDAQERARRIAITLPEIDIAMHGAFVADIAVALRDEDGAPVLAIEALTIRDAAAEDRTPAALSGGARRCG